MAIPSVTLSKESSAMYQFCGIANTTLFSSELFPSIKLRINALLADNLSLSIGSLISLFCAIFPWFILSHILT